MLTSPRSMSTNSVGFWKEMATWSAVAMLLSTKKPEPGQCTILWYDSAASGNTRACVSPLYYLQCVWQPDSHITIFLTPATVSSQYPLTAASHATTVQVTPPTPHTYLVCGSLAASTPGPRRLLQKFDQHVSVTCTYDWEPAFYQVQNTLNWWHPQPYRSRHLWMDANGFQGKATGHRFRPCRRSCYLLNAP